MRNTFEITVKAINGVILNDPQEIIFDCKKVQAVGVQIIRMFDANSCIVNHKIFVFRHGSDLFGTEMFRTMDEYNQYKSVACACCVAECVISFRGCSLSYNDCYLTYSEMILTQN